MNVPWFGKAVCAAAWAIVTYEMLGLFTPLPTISRIIQGWRDDGHYVAVAVLVGVITLVLLVFTLWLFRHLLFSPRSDLLKRLGG